MGLCLKNREEGRGEGRGVEGSETHTEGSWSGEEGGRTVMRVRVSRIQ